MAKVPGIKFVDEDESEIAEAEMSDEQAGEPEISDMTTHERLRAFEDKMFGKDASRINGHVEKGIGSKHANMAAHHKAHHTALVDLVEAEQVHLAAGAAETAAHAKLQAAIERVKATEPKD